VAGTAQRSARCDAPAPATRRLGRRAHFDDYDNAQELKVVAERRVGDGRDATATVTTERSYENDTTFWILGLPTSERRFDAKGDLFRGSFQYARGKLRQSTITRYGVATTCADPVAAQVEERQYTAEGLLSDVWDNNHLVAGGIRPHRHYDYDASWRALTAASTADYTRAGAFAQLSESTTYDYRFGAVTTRTDANNNTTTTLYDALGRVQDVYDADNERVQHIDYDLVARPTTRTVTQYPGAGQPNVVRREYADGDGRIRQQLVYTAAGPVVEAWRSYDSLGGTFEEAQAFAPSSAAFVPRAQMGW
jgi:YD repeat-containing protein